MVGIICGFIVGVLVGFFLTALLAIQKKDNDEQ